MGTLLTSLEYATQYFAIDVECVATGTGTKYVAACAFAQIRECFSPFSNQNRSDRDVARIAVVNEDEQVVFDQYVKPEKEIVSYLTQLTGITERYEHRAMAAQNSS